MGEANPILLMLRDSVPHTTAVRVGKGFQAEVLDWSSPMKGFGVIELVLMEGSMEFNGQGTFFEVQTDVCECFCAIHWDPSHADCAVPQELETDQVLKQLKYVEVVCKLHNFYYCIYVKGIFGD
ncbi:hypothetical protein ACSQ67_014610 [Phaseolus vulgaris]